MPDLETIRKTTQYISAIVQTVHIAIDAKTTSSPNDVSPVLDLDCQTESIGFVQLPSDSIVAILEPIF